MLINLTNHPSEKWGEEQMNAAISAYNDVIDYPFPSVSPNATEEDINHIAQNTVMDITRKYGLNITIHIMGEFTLCYALIKMFKTNGVRCIASCTERIAKELSNGCKISEFHFIKFREYV
jgi:hypothetical protein